MEVNKSHISLFVLDVPRSKEEKVKKVFEETSKELVEVFKTNPVLFDVEGVGKRNIGRGNELLYAEVKFSPEGEKQVYQLTEKLQEKLSQIQEVKVERKKKIFFHVSLLNTKIQNPDMKAREIKEELYSDLSEFKFGKQKINSVQLLATRKLSDSDGYYFCESEVIFDRNL